MTSALRYDDLEMNRVNAIFDEKGDILISLPPNHASALISLIKTVQVTQSWSKNHTPFLARLAPLAKGLLVMLRITIKHSRLIDLVRVIVLNSTSQTLEKLPDGHVLFRFMR
ncbi:MAG: hypothetical protein Q7T96_09565 [Methylobacter sp.]|nr:hypothetical protein [Methylobacter sp.]